MELLIDVTKDGENCPGFYHNENRDAVKEVLMSGKMPDQIRLVTRFEGKDLDVKQSSIRLTKTELLLNDIMNDKSALSRFYSLPGDVEKKADLFLSIWEKLVDGSTAKMVNGTLEDKCIVWYADPDASVNRFWDYDIYHSDNGIVFRNGIKGPFFGILIPEEIIKKNNLDFRYPDLRQLDKNDFTRYVAIDFYDNLAELNREDFPNYKNWIANVSAHWIDYLFAKHE